MKIMTTKIKIRGTDGTEEIVELSPRDVSFYKHETQRIRVTKKGLSKFFSNLLEKLSVRF